MSKKGNLVGSHLGQRGIPLCPHPVLHHPQQLLGLCEDLTPLQAFLSAAYQSLRLGHFPPATSHRLVSYLCLFSLGLGRGRALER